MGSTVHRILARPFRAALVAALVAAVTVGAACAPSDHDDSAGIDLLAPTVDMDERLARYSRVSLTADVSGLSEADREVVRLLMRAAVAMDDVFWRQAWGDPEELRRRVEDPRAARYVQINYGPWDRLADNEPFLEGMGPKPPGANFYPPEVTAAELEAGDEALTDLYTMVRRSAAGELQAIPYHEYFAEQHQAAAALLKEAAAVAEDSGLARYLELRAEALLTDEYRASDMAWMDMKDNAVDVVIGPIETYEDQLLGAKAAHETFVLVKDMEWSARLQRFAAFLPALQEGLPVEARYRQVMAGTDSDLNAYDVVYVSGDANAGSKTIAINLPNDEEVQLARGTRRLQLKNAMRAKFDEILLPIADVVIAEDQRTHVTFDAFFANTMFHEVAHGLGIKETLTGRGTVREALREHASAMEEGKADVLGLYMVTELFEDGELAEGTLEDYYTTFLASIFRSVRFGASSAHGRANMVRFNWFQEHGAFTRDEETGTYRVDMERMREAMSSLGERILVLQGDGDYEGVAELLESRGVIPDALRADLDRLGELGIPVDIVYEQGPSILFGG